MGFMYIKKAGVSMPLIHLTEEQVRKIISLSEAWNRTYPPSELGDDFFEDAEKSYEHLHAPELAEFTAYITALSDEARYELMALMWLGRGDSGQNFGQLITYAKKKANKGDVNYIVEKIPALPRYLADGLKLL